jgi:hypothetical protein
MNAVHKPFSAWPRVKPLVIAESLKVLVWAIRINSFMKIVIMDKSKSTA